MLHSAQLAQEDLGGIDLGILDPDFQWLEESDTFDNRNSDPLESETCIRDFTAHGIPDLEECNHGILQSASSKMLSFFKSLTELKQSLASRSRIGDWFSFHSPLVRSVSPLSFTSTESTLCTSYASISPPTSPRPRYTDIPSIPTSFVSWEEARFVIKNAVPITDLDRVQTFLLAAHPRLGRRSKAQALPNELFRHISGFLLDSPGIWRNSRDPVRCRACEQWMSCRARQCSIQQFRVLSTYIVSQIHSMKQSENISMDKSSMYIRDEICPICVSKVIQRVREKFEDTDKDSK